MPWRNIGRNLLAVLIGIFLSFVLLEGLLRIFEPIEYRVKGNKIELPQDRKFQITNNKTDKLDRIITTSRNHLGLRGDEPPKDFADCLTIIAGGGSTTECSVISDGKTWCDLLAAKLKEKFNPLWLNNGGLNGHSTFGHLIFMQDYILKIKPKVFLFLTGANDIGLVAPWEWDQNYRKKNPVLGWLASLWGGLINHSLVLSYAVNFGRYSKANRMGLTHPIFDFAKLKQLDIPPEKAAALLQEHREKYLKDYGERLDKLIEISRSHNIEPVFITQPMVFGDLIDPPTGVNLAKAMCWWADGKTIWQLLELYNDVVRKTCREHHVKVIELARKMPKNTNFYYDTYHYTNAGCQQVAEIVYQGLEPFLEKKFPHYVRSTTKP
jgi:lysophospholipase L1-like esterase